MNCQEAIDVMCKRCICHDVCGETGCEPKKVLEAMSEYERLKERDTPYKPTPDTKYYGNGICKCGAVFLDKDMQFCGNCGQRLDWEQEIGGNDEVEKV